VTDRVLLNALALRPEGSGVQTYIRHLVRAMAERTDARLVAMVQHDAGGSLPPSVERLSLPPMHGIRRAAHGLAPRRGFDLVHGLNVALPLAPGTPKVVTVHDLVQFDLPEVLAPSKAAAMRFLMRAAVRRADAIIAVSSFTAERIKEILHIEATPIVEAPGPEFTPPAEERVESVRKRHDLPVRFVLHVGTVGARKDVTTLSDACRQAHVPLILAGDGRFPDEAHVLRLGWVPDADLAALYGAATVVAYPSRYEGFGLPPLEAMACGAPVIASDIPPLRETLTGAAELVPVRDAETLAAKIVAVVNDADRRAEMRRAGIERAASFSWDRTAEQTLAVYRSLGAKV
jgi:glycosyltransferase involved in cell wall biosynthesis